MGAHNSSAYEKQKKALAELLQVFLKSVSPLKNLQTATPEDIVKFLIFKDQQGKTKVHVAECTCTEQESCDCPKRLAFKTVDAYVGNIRSIFNEEGRGGQWDDRLGLGNPAASHLVKKYLKAVTEEQLRQGRTPQQAKPFFCLRFWRYVTTGGYLFRSTSKEGHMLTDPPSTSALDNAFRRYLEQMGRYEGETLHGCRAGCAISLHMAGESTRGIMEHVGWFNKRTASYYMKLAQVTQSGRPA
ncbi:uncharacterized protein LOC118407113 [Branchiostoma floridae]|uniref:Uncharacterized protein LOC118407113 n=1 Tax=Branchiostoma floridae TaxID=7739 RepID=A0A9J7KHJ8_BRAFL|nr:uncharacterized protein LOC118407113 [Branchiostoma floridae]